MLVILGSSIAMARPKSIQEAFLKHNLVDFMIPSLNLRSSSPDPSDSSAATVPMNKKAMEVQNTTVMVSCHSMPQPEEPQPSSWR